MLGHTARVSFRLRRPCEERSSLGSVEFRVSPGWMNFIRLVGLDDILISVATRGLNVRMVSIPSDCGTTFDNFYNLKKN
jgi:hypothetical protein